MAKPMADCSPSQLIALKIENVSKLLCCSKWCRATAYIGVDCRWREYAAQARAKIAAEAAVAVHADLADLARRIESLNGPDRAIDAEIAERAFGWKRTRIGADYDGKNASEILTQSGQLPGYGYSYPPRGAIPLWYHVPAYTRDCREPELPRDTIRRHYAAVLRGG